MSNINIINITENICTRVYIHFYFMIKNLLLLELS